jgi:outer membrane biogenesis lipoprotein LolB
MKRLIFSLPVVVAVLVSACATTAGNTPDEKRQAVQAMRQEVLSNLYRIKPAARNLVRSSPGYAVFSNANVNIILLEG